MAAEEAARPSPARSRIKGAGGGITAAPRGGAAADVDGPALEPATQVAAAANLSCARTFAIISSGVADLFTFAGKRKGRGKPALRPALIRPSLKVHSTPSTSKGVGSFFGAMAKAAAADSRHECERERASEGVMGLRLSLLLECKFGTCKSGNLSAFACRLRGAPPQGHWANFQRGYHPG